MSLHLQVNVPASAWAYFPLPNLSPAEASPAGYEVVVEISLPTFFAQLLGISQESQDVPEPELVSTSRKLIEDGSFILCHEGMGGTYFIKEKNSKTIVSVFKPQDEEPGAPNNPKGVVKKPLLPPGEGALREVAAYLLDRGFAGVPETYYMKNVHHAKFSGNGMKQGSLQRFVTNDGVSSDLGSSQFSTEDVHRIGVLDVRLFNLDRNGENILLYRKPQEPGQRETYGLIPIDHTYCLPAVNSLNGAYFEWQYWSQAKKPFSAETSAYVNLIDIERDAQTLRDLGLPEESIATMVVCTLLLKKAVELGKTLFDVASLMTRKDLNDPSPLEALIEEAEKRANLSNVPFLDEFEKFLPDLLAKC